MAELKLTVGALTATLTAPNATAQVQLAAYARKLGALPGESAQAQGQRVLRALARIVTSEAHAQIILEALNTAQQQIETDNPRPGEWSE